MGDVPHRDERHPRSQHRAEENVWPYIRMLRERWLVRRLPGSRSTGILHGTRVLRWDGLRRAQFLRLHEAGVGLAQVWVSDNAGALTEGLYSGRPFLIIFKSCSQRES